MVCPKFNFYVYKVKRSAVGEYICFCFVAGGSKEVLPLGSAQCSKKIADKPMNVALSKKKEKDMSAPMN
jgi:hypothetical protein